MFAKTIVLSDAFLDMPATARCLYFTLGMFADDDGFVNNPKSIMRQCGASDDDMKILLSKKFVLIFESGVIVIKHWRINNYLQKDRIQPTKYIEEKQKLDVEPNGGYTLKDNVYTGMYTEGVYTQNRVIGNNVISSNLIKDIKNIPSNSPQEAIDLPSEATASGTANAELLSIEESWFTAFWERYPVKRDKKAAHKTFLKVCKKQETYDAIMNALDRQIPTWKDPKYIPYPSTWLNGERWNDEIKPTKQAFSIPFPEIYEGGNTDDSF